MSGTSDRIEVLQPASNSSCIISARGIERHDGSIVGGEIDENIYLVCNTVSRTCMEIDIKKPEKQVKYTHLTSQPRLYPGGIVVGSKLLLSGGVGLTNSELVGIEGSEPIPTTFSSTHKFAHGHCIVKLNATTIFSTSGISGGDPGNTWFCHVDGEPSSWRWIPGPKMSNRRENHSCLKWNFNGRTIVIVVGGSKSWTRRTEFIDIEGNKLIFGKHTVIFTRHFCLELSKNVLRRSTNPRNISKSYPV